MKITKVNTYVLKKKLLSTMHISRGGLRVRSHAIVEVETDTGITGLGEGVGNTSAVGAILERDLAPRAIGLNPMAIEQVREALLDSHVYFERKGSVVAAASAIEMACWDIKAKALKVPLYELLGGSFQPEMEAYVSSLYWEEDPGDMAAHARGIYEQGFRAFKVHLGCRPPEEETVRIRAVREAIGTQSRLMIDLNAGYDYLAALRACRLWEPFDLTWIEEPLNPNLVDRMADLRRHSSIPLAAGENEFRVFGFKELFEKRAIDIAMPDIARVGGIQETKNVCVLAGSHGLTVSPHCFSSGILLAATLHLMASTPGTQWVEFDASDNAIYQELFVEPVKVSKGKITVPTGLGLGVELRRSVLEKYLEASS